MLCYNVSTTKVPTRGDGTLVTNMKSYTLYLCDATNEYDKKKNEQMRKVHEEIKRVSLTAAFGGI